MTILDNDVSAADRELPPRGSIMEKMYANKPGTPIRYRRNREWTDTNWRSKKEWKRLYQHK